MLESTSYRLWRVAEHEVSKDNYKIEVPVGVALHVGIDRQSPARVS